MANDKRPQVVVREIELVRLIDSSNGMEIVRFATANRVEGEQVFREATIKAIEKLLDVRDAATLLALSNRESAGAALDILRDVLGITKADLGPRGNVSAKIVIDGVRNDETGKIDAVSVKTVELYRALQRIDFPFKLEPGEDMFAEIIFGDDVVGTSRVFCPLSSEPILIENIQVEKSIVPARGLGLQPTCSSCGASLRPGEKPAIEEVYREDQGPRRWTCAACSIATLTRPPASRPAPPPPSATPMPAEFLENPIPLDAEVVAQFPGFPETAPGPAPTDGDPFDPLTGGGPPASEGNR